MLCMSCELLCCIFQVSQRCLTLLTFEMEVKWKLCHLFPHVARDSLKCEHLNFQNILWVVCCLVGVFWFGWVFLVFWFFCIKRHFSDTKVHLYHNEI